MPSSLRAFLDLELARLAPLGCSTEHLRLALERQIREQLSWVDDLERAREFAALCPVPGTEPGDYRPRLLCDSRALAGVRFLGGDLGHPFVAIYQRSAPLEATPELVPAALRAFAPFRPREVRLLLSREEERALSKGRPDFRIIAGRVAHMLSIPRPEDAARIELVRLTDFSFYDDYIADYAAFHREAPPEIASVVPVEARETLEPALTEGTLFAIRVEGRRAGLIGFRRATIGGVPGFEVVEEILAPEFRGQRLGHALQRRAAEVLPASDQDCIVGTIHPANLPSLRTALRAGRVDVGGYWFVQR